MPVSSEYIGYVMEQLEPLGQVRKQRLFGGFALSRDGVQFALVIRNCLYFAVDDVTRPQYQRYGMQCFAYSTRKGQVQVRSYFEVPEEVLIDSEMLRAWVGQSLQVTQRKAKTTATKKAAKKK